jgi:NAD-dependent dihydropyrimidine dehydrogenase PreA subunit
MNVVYYIGGALLALWFFGGMYRHKKGRNKIIHVVEDNCTGCRRCLKRCRHHVLDTVSDEKGAPVYVKNPAHCTACGDCLSGCKFKALVLMEKK